MDLSENAKVLIQEFVDERTIQAEENFINHPENDSASVDIIARMFGFEGEFSQISAEAERKLVVSFKHNLELLIQKTWVEKSDIALKEQILFQLGNLCEGDFTWEGSYSLFLDLIYSAVYLMFGQQAKSDDFCEYSLRIDPEFGTFWWYIQSLPQDTEWSEPKYRNAVLLGMYFLANY